MRSLISTLRRKACFACALLVLGGCAEDPNADRVPPEQIQNVRHVATGLPLPPSASNVWNFENRFQDAIQLLRFDASLADARRFARAVLQRDPVPGEPPLWGRQFDRAWWLKNYPAGGEGGEFQDRPHGVVKLVLAPMGDRARVWVITSDDCRRPQACTTWKLEDLP